MAVVISVSGMVVRPFSVGNLEATAEKPGSAGWGPSMFGLRVAAICTTRICGDAASNSTRNQLV